MRLFHVSEEPNIAEFVPRLPTRKDLDRGVGLVWAIDEKHLSNFLTPRNCPRVCYCAGSQTTPEDCAAFFTGSQRHCVVIESSWFARMARTTLYLYEFDNRDFMLQDPVAGYYVATKTQFPIAVHRIDAPFAEILSRNVELRVVDDLAKIAETVKSSTLDWSLCRMGFAKRKAKT